MAKKEFWRDWKRITPTEEKAIKSIRKAKRLLFNTVNKEDVQAIYIKGSFVRREMNDTSDVDIVPIVYKNATLNAILTLDHEHGAEYRPSELHPNSLWELKHRKRYHARKETGPKGAPAIDEFVRYRIIWGKELTFTDFPPRTSKRRLQGMIHAWENIFIPLYDNGTFPFHHIIKQVFWLTEYEQMTKGNPHTITWKELVESVKDKRHVVHDAWKYRQQPTHNTQEQKRFIAKLKKHLANIKHLADD